MNALSISTLATIEASRAAITRNQSRLADVNIEVSSGRHADVGRTLGVRTALDLNLRSSLSDLDGLQSANGIVGARLAQTQTALSAIGELADGFMQAVLSSGQSGADRTVLISDAKARLETLSELLSTTSNGAFVFGGTNVGAQPFERYTSNPTSASRASILAAFTGEFGIAPDDAAVSALTRGQVETYLDGTFAALFEDPSWQTNFSAANDNAMIDRISIGETIETSVSASNSGIRKLVFALTAVVDAGTANLNADAYSALSAKLTSIVGGVGSDIASLQSRLGISQERLAKAGERIVVQQSYFSKSIGEAENVDAGEAAIQLNSIMAQLEASYAVTARLQRMSLLNYLTGT